MQCGLSVNIAFPYASCDITGSDWNNTDGHSNFLNASHIHRQIDDTAYYANFNINGTGTSQHTANNSTITSDSNVTINKCNNSAAATIKSNGIHSYNITTTDDELNMSVNFNKSIYTPAHTAQLPVTADISGTTTGQLESFLTLIIKSLCAV